MKRALLFFLLLIFGVSLRFYGVDWSLPNLFHPDETRLLYAVNDLEPNHWNPKFFAYGSLPIYLLKIVHLSAETAAQWLGKRPPRVDFFLTGRMMSALFGSLTLLLLYRFGKRFFSERVGLLSLAFLSLTVLHIQLSHFLTVDVMLTFFVLLAVYCAARLVESPDKFRFSALSGAATGLALATKVSAAPLFGVLALAHLLALFASRQAAKPPSEAPFAPLRLGAKFKEGRRFAARCVAAALIAGAVFVACEPYAVLDFQEFSRQIKEQNDMVLGKTQPPYVIQYERTPKYWYQIEQAIRHGMGVPLGLLALIATLAVSFGAATRLANALFQRKTPAETPFPNALLLTLAWVWPVFLMVGGFTVKFPRYLLPLMPFFCLFAAVFADDLPRRIAKTGKNACSTVSQWLIYAALAGILGYSAAYAIAFAAIYGRDDPRAQASRAIYAHVPAGSLILTELWEFTSLVPLDNGNPSEYRVDSLDLYPPDSAEKIERIARQLSEADVILLATKRLYGSILRVPDRYPLTVNYYRLLFDGALGFAPAPPFTTYPSLLGWQWNDDFADESLTVYEHPKTILFQKVRDIPADELAALILNAPKLDNADALLRRLIAFPAQEADEAALLRHALQPRRAAPVSGGFQWAAALLWLGAVELLGLLAFPFIALAFGKLADNGYAVAKAFGLLLPAYLVWIGASLNLFAATRPAIFAAIALIGAASLTLALWLRRHFLRVIRRRWKIFLAYEAAFCAAFAGFLAFRAFNPDIFWSESSMDFSILNVLTRSEAFPPVDPWMSGHPLNYYYIGHFLAAMLAKLTNIAPQIAYNLAFALFPALVALQAFSLLYNLTRRYAFAAAGVLFSAILGNLDGLLLLNDIWRGRESYFRLFRCAHEVIPFTVHEFPFWTFIFVDLHAHLLNMPFLLATFHIGLNLLSLTPAPSPKEGDPTPTLFFPTGRGILSPLAFGSVCALIVGTLAVISSWDFPTGVMFLLLAAALQTWRNRARLQADWLASLAPMFAVLLIIPVSLLLYRPFFAAFSRKGMGIGLVRDLTTPLPGFLTMFGFFLFVILSWLAWRAARQKARRPQAAFGALIVVLGIIAFAAPRIGGTDRATLLFALALAGFSAIILFRRIRVGHADRFAWLCLCYACLIVAGCELIFIRDFLQGGEYKRMNTIFKFYLPAWFLLSIAAAYGVARIAARFVSRKRARPLAATLAYRAWFAVLRAFVIACAIFPVMALYAKRHHQDIYGRAYLPPTLDGLAYMQASAPDECAAIRWLNEHVAGTPVILEAVGADYLYEYARVSANTGLPTVLGWPSHADQREHWTRTARRREDVNTMYSSRDLARVIELLRHYQVEYIYVGATERRDFSPDSLRKFDEFPKYFTPVFRAGETVIYQARYFRENA